MVYQPSGFLISTMFSRVSSSLPHRSHETRTIEVFIRTILPRRRLILWAFRPRQQFRQGCGTPPMKQPSPESSHTYRTRGEGKSLQGRTRFPAGGGGLFLPLCGFTYTVATGTAAGYAVPVVAMWAASISV